MSLRVYGFRLALKVLIGRSRIETRAINDSRRSNQCRHKTDFRYATAINTARLQPVCTVEGSFVTNHGVRQQSASVRYAFQVASQPSQLTLQDSLILHALGVAWNGKKREVTGARASKFPIPSDCG
jgi:hypothetical protein